MSEENGSFFGQIKNQIIAGVGVVITAVGGVVVSQIEGLFGIEEEAPTEQVQPATQSQEVNVSGPEIIINIPEQKPVKEKVIVKEVPAKPKKTETEKRKEEGLDW